MKLLSTVAFIGCLILQSGCALGQQKAAKLFFLEDVKTNRWCAFDEEPVWNAAVQEVEAMTVGALTYSSGRLLRIDVTEAGESGDWIVYDNYFIDGKGRVTKLSRLINVLPDDRSVSQTFSILEGKPTMTMMTEKELGSGKLLASPEPAWLPDLPIRTELKQFPFSGFLVESDIGLDGRVCIRASS